MTKKDQAHNEAAPSIEELHRSILRKLAIVLGDPHSCPDRRCRRVRRCVGEDLSCLNCLPEPSAAEGDAALAALQAALKRSVAQNNAASGAGAAR